MENLKVNDALNLAKDKEILSIIKSETLYYCDVINKINHYGMSQERCVILTDKALYNMKKKLLEEKYHMN